MVLHSFEILDQKEVKMKEQALNMVYSMSYLLDWKHHSAIRHFTLLYMDCCISRQRHNKKKTGKHPKDFLYFIIPDTALR